MRKFTEFANNDPVAINLVTELPTISNDPVRYQKQMIMIGDRLGASVLSRLDPQKQSEICIISTVEDADFLARGVIDHLESAGLGPRIHFMCIWNEKIKRDGVSLSPISRQYAENFEAGDVTFVIVKSIISGACVVKTNLLRALSVSDPERIFVVSPVMLEGAEERLSVDFPDHVTEKFEFIHFATDTDLDGENVVPGIGGSVYELLGFQNNVEKNRYVPDIVKQRRRKYFCSEAIA
jgi:hypothetical protein